MRLRTVSGVCSWLDMGESPIQRLGAQMGAVIKAWGKHPLKLAVAWKTVGNSLTDDGTWKATCFYDLAEIVGIRSKDLLMQTFI